MTRATAAHALGFCALVCTLAAGCAAPGEPSPRHPVVPAPIADLAARQSGSDVVLTFSVPAKSMDRETLAEAPSIEIYRAALPPGALASPKTAWRLVYAIPSERVDSYVTDNHFEFRDPLTPDDLGRAAGSSLAYMVRSREVRARASEDSNIITLRVYPPPEPPRDLHFSITAGIVLSWSESPLPAGSTPGGYRVYRAEVDSTQGPVQDLRQAKLKSPPELAGTTFLPNFSPPDMSLFRTYLYTVRSVALFGGDTVESADSAPAGLTLRDEIVALEAPRGLVIAVIPATPQAPAYVELSWAIGSGGLPEGFLAGYNVYRSDSENTPGERISTEILPSPAFRDISVVSGKRYYYRVSAVDRAGNESPKSSAVQTDIP